MKTLCDVTRRFAALCRGKSADFVHAEPTESVSGNGKTGRFKIYTASHSYAIKALEEPGKKGYLGCIASARKPRAGEDWTRGNDLPDGPLNEKTWTDILAAIVRYELVRLGDG